MTSQHDALYRAICEHPDEDTPRLAFADLLDEEGEAERAAFIRTQIELDKVPEYDPLWVKCRQFDRDAKRGWAMMHTLPKRLPPGFSWHKAEFRRGFPWLVGVERFTAFAEGAPDLFAVAPIRAIHVSSRVGIAGLSRCPHLGRLTRLECSDTRLDGDDTNLLGDSEHAANLTELAFSHDGIDADGLRALVESPLFGPLTSLELRENAIAPELLVDALGAAAGPGHLRALSIPHSGITRDDAANLFDLPVLRELDHLDLGDNRLNAAGVAALAESRATCWLRVLNLSGTRPGVTGIRALTEEKSRLARLRSLDVSHSGLGPVAVEYLARAAGLRKLQVLNLAENPVCDRGAVALANSPHLSELLELDLSDAEVGDAGAVALADSPYLDNLLRLDLRCRKVGRPLGPSARRALRERFEGRVSL
jgi:uncharacterized protein (TIGR02996 family)